MGTFLSDPGIWGPIFGSGSLSLSERPFADLTDVTCGKHEVCLILMQAYLKTLSICSHLFILVLWNLQCGLSTAPFLTLSYPVNRANRELQDNLTAK